MKLIGFGFRHAEGKNPHDYYLDTQLGLALVTSGLGAVDSQARAAAVLATWSVVDEAEANNDGGALARGALRAHRSIDRISAGWQGLLRPTAMVAALRLFGSSLQIAHAGRCRVLRIGEGRLEALTEDHDLGREAARAAGSSTHVKPEVARVPTRALGATSAIDVRDVAVKPGDELLIATPGLEERLTPALLAELCDRERPLSARAIALWDHACACAVSFAFVLVRVVSEDVHAYEIAGSHRPEPDLFVGPEEVSPPPIAGCDRGPDERWCKEVEGRIVMDWERDRYLTPQLWVVAAIHPDELANVALLRACRWSLESLAKRYKEGVPEPLQALLRVIVEARAWSDLGDAGRAACDDFYEWSKEHLSGGGPQGAVDRVLIFIENLSNWQSDPESLPDLGAYLEDLVHAEGQWDWDEGLAEVHYIVPEKFGDAMIARDEQRTAARRAMILLLAEIAPEPWVLKR